MKTNRISHFLSIIIVLTVFVNINKIFSQESDQFVVVLDAGHGGKDSGTPGTKRYKTT